MYPALSALRQKRIPHELFEVEEKVIAQPKLDGIWFKLNPITLVGYTKDHKSYDFKDIMKFHKNPMIPLCYHITQIKYLVGELCYIDPVTKKITRNRHFVMNCLRKHKDWENYAPNIVLIIYDVILTNDYVKFINDYDPKQDPNYNNTLPINDSIQSNLYWPHSEKISKTYNKIFEIFVQSNAQLLKNSFFRCMESMITEYGKLAEVEQYYFKKYKPLEGIILKRIDSSHPSLMSDKFRKVHPDWFKIKPVFDATLRCVAIKPHSKNPNLIGALILEDADKEIRISVGSGLKKEFRNKTKEEVIGKLFEIEFEDIYPKSKMFSHPVVIEERLDMEEADSWTKLVTRVIGVIK